MSRKGKKPATDRPLAVVVLAAGVGKRMRSATAKVLHPLAGRPLLAHVLGQTARLDPVRSVVVVGHQAEAVAAVVGERAVCVTQREQLGTGHAVAAARRALRGFSGDVMVVSGDVPLLRAATLKKLLRRHRSSKALATVLTMVVDDPSGYGRILRQEEGCFRIVEHADAGREEREIDEVNSGIYCFDARFLLRTLSALDQDNAQAEYYLTDLIEKASAKGTAAALVAEDESELMGVDSRLGLARAEALMQERLILGWMERGVTFLDPASVYLSVDVRMGRDCVIGPGVRLEGATRLGRECVVDGSAFLKDTVVGDSSHVRWGVVADGARIGKTVQVGPYSHLRPEAELGAESHIGNFVEVKKSKIGRGSKANHLSYIGDATVGRDVNIGAGTITCNYDGFAKHRTEVGDRVQIGSDTQLVAPVKVGADCYVAAGSTVTSDVAPGSLVFNDKRQQVRSGWVEGFRRRSKKARKTGKDGGGA